MKKVPLDDEAAKQVMELSENTLKFLEQNIKPGKYTTLNMILNVLTSCVFRVSAPLLPNEDAQKKFAMHIAQLLILNYENMEKNKE
jgi:hypothetical protein